MVRLPVCGQADCGHDHSRGVEPRPSASIDQAHPSALRGVPNRPRVVVTGCWATSDRAAAAALPGVDAVLTHHDDVAGELGRLLEQWREVACSLPPHAAPDETTNPLKTDCTATPAEPVADDGWMKEAGAPAGGRTTNNKALSAE